VGVVSGLGLLVAGWALTGCAQPVASADAPPTVQVSTTTQAPPTTPVRQEADTVAPEPPPCGLGIKACVRLSTGQAWLRTSPTTVTGPVLIGYGVGAHATPTGRFQVSWKAEHWVSMEYHEPMPDAVFFAAGGIAFHAGALDHSSHGCVHLEPHVAAQFFSVLKPGDPVQVLS
jgi:lipoprotein-anchoring transpeptidase ErfK/SrfK